MTRQKSDKVKELDRLSAQLERSGVFINLRRVHYEIFVINYYPLPGRMTILSPADNIADKFFVEYSKRFGNQQLLDELISTIRQNYDRDEYNPLGTVTRIEVGSAILKHELSKKPERKRAEPSSSQMEDLDRKVKEAIANMRQKLTNPSIHTEDVKIIERALREYRLMMGIAVGAGTAAFGIIVILPLYALFATPEKE